jgi:hypothetical protein
MTAKKSAFDIVCDIFQLNHRKNNGDTPVFTLNRLFLKNLSGKPVLGQDCPRLTNDNTGGIIWKDELYRLSVSLLF